uniref:Serpin domain-containing protein n=1 Tax=Panagrolaimus superbus TaxID=310955 RepID=A0A914Y203_9BILA
MSTINNEFCGKVIIPEFEVSSTFDLIETLRNLNIYDAFDNLKADLSGTSNESLFISIHHHQAVIKVSEDGTKASAATMMEEGLLRYDEPNFEFIADHPFLFLIADETNNIYFIGSFFNSFLILFK